MRRTDATVEMRKKPRLRGWIHAAALPAVIVGGTILLRLCDTTAELVAVSAWLVTAVLLYATSAVYHIGNWSPGIAAVLRRIDHANISLFIAGTYSPLAVSLLSGSSKTLLLRLIWSVAVVTVLFRIFWLGAPRVLYVGIYLLMGWISVGWLYQFWLGGGWAVVILLLCGGLFYSFGALIYAFRRPDPFPQWFGFHELFHLGTVLASGCFYTAAVIAVTCGKG